jgi:hypothetical protein
MFNNIKLQISEIWNSRSPKKKQFNAILSLAHAIANDNPNALVDYVKLVARHTQSIYISEILKTQEKGTVPDITPSFLWFDQSFPISKDGKRIYELRAPIQKDCVINLKTNIVLPWPWERGRVISNFTFIEPSTWKQDANHCIDYILPFGIGYVYGGNHSITVGIVRGEGVIIPRKIYDYSPIFQHVRCDGNFFIRKYDNKIIQKVSNIDFAAIFEIGRLMQSLGVSA